MTWLRALFNRFVTWISAFFYGFFIGKLREQKKQSEKREKDAQKNAQKWADRGLKPTSKRLRELSKRKRDS